MDTYQSSAANLMVAVHRGSRQNSSEKSISQGVEVCLTTVKEKGTQPATGSTLQALILF
jgi:hypothetical protein|tara:strand:+ start:620 stop:796 length:177 start_codon:yes stop_codon:yes gene_type:complete